jgi:hypothetical protein
MTTNNDDSTQASSLSQLSTVSTATTGSSLTPPVIQQPRMSPPRTVHLLPGPAPYAQLCFDPQENTLMTLLLGKPRVSKYTQLDDAPDLIDLISSQSSSVDSSSGWSSDSPTSSSSSSGDTGWHSSSPQEIVWMDRWWLYDDGSDCSDTYRALLHDSECSESSADESDSAGCGKKFLRSVSLCKLKPHHRAQQSGSPKHSQREVEQNRFSLGKDCRYMTLDE